MLGLPAVRRWLLAGLTAVIFGAALLAFNWAQSETGVPFPRNAGNELSPPDWPMFGGSPSRNMVSTTARNLPVTWDFEANPKKNILWIADLGSRSFGGPMISDGKVFVGTNNNDPRDKKFTKIVEGKTVCTDLGVLMAFEQSSGKFLYQTIFRKLEAGRVNDWPQEGLCSTPTAERDRMYFTNNRCEVVCAKIATGELIWKLDMMKELGVFPHNMTTSSPVIVGDNLFLVTSNGVDEGHLNIPAPLAPSFIKLSKRDGKVRWQNNEPTIKWTQANANFKKLVDRAELLQHGQWSSPAYAFVAGQPQIVFPGGDGWIYTFDPDGKLLWKFDGNPKDAHYELGSKGTRSDFIGAPVIYKNRVYIGMGQDPEHEFGVGHLWCIAMDKRGDVSPELVVNAAVFPPVTRPNPNSAKVWHFGGPVPAAKQVEIQRTHYFSRTMSTCAIHDDLVYAADLSGLLVCLDAETGQAYWEHDTMNNTWASPFWADDKVYLGNDGGELWVFAHGKEKKVLGHAELNGQTIRTTPVAVGEVLYVVAGNQLFALGNKK